MTHIFDPQRSASIGKPAAPPFIAPIPTFSRLDTIRRATSLVASVVWRNSRFEIDRAGVRILSRFIRQTKLTRVFVWGHTDYVFAFWSAIAGRSLSAKPT